MEKYPEVSEESIYLGLTPEEVSLLFFLFGLTTAQSLTIDDLNTTANGLFLSAQVMFLIASQRNFINDLIDLQEEKEDEKDIKSQVQKLQDQIQFLQKQLDEFKK